MASVGGTTDTAVDTGTTGGLSYRLYVTPADLAGLTAVAERQRRIWLDTELADWNTRTPRLSLIQLRLEDGSLHVIDVLAPGMRAAYLESFAPRVLAAPHLEKWAHYARFERRVFGPDLVKNLHCTFELARGVPYHRLPLRSLRLAMLVQHLFGETIDKSYQRADWGHRPLRPEELDYAAWDPEWCYRVHERINPLVRSWDPAADDPQEIATRYDEILPSVRDASNARAAIWAAVKAFMVGGPRERFSDFLLQTRVIRTVPIRALAAAVAEADPMGTAEFSVPVPATLVEALLPGGEAACREAGRETVTTRFRGPRAERARVKPVYEVDAEDPETVAREFAAADHRHRRLESERQELRERMRAWMTQAGAPHWGGFELSDSTPRVHTDVRDVVAWLRDDYEPSTGLPGRFLQALGAAQVAALSDYVDATALPVMRWRPDHMSLPIDMAQSRDWHAEDDGA
jgi:ribonuclease D